jgi:hypothetical protein
MYVTKDSVTKHCSSLAHSIGMSCESLEMETVGPSSSAEGCGHDNTATGSASSSIELEGPPKKQLRSPPNVLNGHLVPAGHMAGVKKIVPLGKVAGVTDSAHGFFFMACTGCLHRYYCEA